MKKILWIYFIVLFGALGIHTMNVSYWLFPLEKEVIDSDGYVRYYYDENGTKHYEELTNYTNWYQAFPYLTFIGLALPFAPFVAMIILYLDKRYRVSLCPKCGTKKDEL